MKRIFKSLYKIVFIVLVAFLIFLSLFSGLGGEVHSVFADTASYSTALTDLQKDSDFDISGYPSIPTDYSLQVIQIAESLDGDLLVYVYQPGSLAFEYKACSINIAREQDNSINLSFENYGLTYLNNNGVFYKYKVDNFKINVALVRYYNISNILRPWDRYMDMNTGNDNTVSEVSYKVAQYWTVTGTGETVSYFMTTSEIVTIEEKYVGYLNYSDGATIKWNSTSSGSTNAHFVAFSTDRQIDKLLCATLSFVEQPVQCRYCCNISHTLLSNSHSYKEYYNFSDLDPIKQTKTITYKDKGGNTGGGNLSKADPYAWERIRTTSEFLVDENNKDYVLTGTGEDNIKNTQWVLSFYETANYYKTSSSDTWQILNPLGWAFIGEAYVQYSEISEVMILQLEFETDGQTYKLGVVDNKQTGGGISGNTSTKTLATTLGQVFAYIWNCLKLVFTGKAGLIEYLVTFAVFAVVALLIVGVIKLIKFFKRRFI